ncbi:MAG: cystathionine beta-synthase [Thermoleophilaceae bacterium]|jgi:cystathionine beta-synthase|nr:cystathionine beta-synthase [Thermoleophilaceae bacterium]
MPDWDGLSAALAEQARHARDRGGICDSILDAVGWTPVIRLARLTRDIDTQLVAKLETANPGGSIKDRVGLAMVEAAERDGLLRPGGTVVEASSGNTGIGIAMAARVKGYRVVVVTKEKTSKEKVSLLQAYGVEVVITPSDATIDSPDCYYNVAKRLAGEIPGAFQPDQYANPANPDVHYRTTGPELWGQTAGQVTHLVAGVGTGGTISGIGRYLKEQNSDIEVIGVDPFGSIYTRDEVQPWLVEGIGQDVRPETYDPTVVDRLVNVLDVDAVAMTRTLAETEGVLVGGSSGMAAFAALALARELDDPTALVGVILPDGGRSYMSTVFNPKWREKHDVGRTLRRFSRFGRRARARDLAISESRPADETRTTVSLEG